MHSICTSPIPCSTNHSSFGKHGLQCRAGRIVGSGRERKIKYHGRARVHVRTLVWHVPMFCPGFISWLTSETHTSSHFPTDCCQEPDAIWRSGFVSRTRNAKVHLSAGAGDVRDAYKYTRCAATWMELDNSSILEAAHHQSLIVCTANSDLSWCCHVLHHVIPILRLGSSC